jgi:PAS domain S-box-containing protein
MRDAVHEAQAEQRDVHILLLEDCELDAELLAAHLAKADMRFTMERVANRRDFIAALNTGLVDIIVADYSLPDFDGLSALAIAGTLQPDTPFIFVSGVVGEDFATNALKRGATDYVLKRNLARVGTAVTRALEQARVRVTQLRTEEALRQSEISSRLSIEAAQLGLWEFYPLTQELKLDARCRALFGMSPEDDITLDRAIAAIHPDDRQRVMARLERSLQFGAPEAETHIDEFRVVTPQGEERWLSSRGQARFAGGQCTLLVGVMRDVTDEHHARDGLRRLAEELEAKVAQRTAERDRIWRLSPDLFASIGSDGRLRSVNPAWSTTLGYEKESVVGQLLLDLVHPDERPGAVKALERLNTGLAVERFEKRIRHRDGSWRWISWTVAPDDGVFYAVGRDTTAERSALIALGERNRELAAEIEERERIEEALRQMQRLEAVGQLTSGVAHDFNNLLTVILGNVGFIERTVKEAGLPPRTLERLGHMRVAAERGAKLTAQMLAFSRRQKLAPKRVNLNETVNGMQQLLQSTLAGAVRIETALQSGLWPALVDPTQIELIILNLAINARDAMEVGGTLTISTSNANVRTMPTRPEEPAPGRYVVLSVSDTGAGMSPEVLAKAFEPFFTTKEIGKGSGLGLAQVYGFAKQSGGGVSIDSKTGHGTRVEVFLPRADADVQVEEEPDHRMPQATNAGCTILLIDDDPDVREIASAMLEDLGCTVIGVGSGGAALDLLASGEPISLILSDYAMPGMNGAEVERAAEHLRPGVPLIFMTGYADLTALRHVGGERIIRKPFNESELARKIGLALPADATNNDS